MPPSDSASRWNGGVGLRKLCQKAPLLVSRKFRIRTASRRRRAAPSGPARGSAERRSRSRLATRRFSSVVVPQPQPGVGAFGVQDGRAGKERRGSPRARRCPTRRPGPPRPGPNSRPCPVPALASSPLKRRRADPPASRPGPAGRAHRHRRGRPPSRPAPRAARPATCPGAAGSGPGPLAARRRASRT